MKGRWSVRKRKGVWQIIGPDEVWHDTEPTLIEAHDEATRLAIHAELSKPTGLLCYFGMRRLAERTATDGWLLQGCGPSWLDLNRYVVREYFA